MKLILTPIEYVRDEKDRKTEYRETDRKESIKEMSRVDMDQLFSCCCESESVNG